MPLNDEGPGLAGPPLRTSVLAALTMCLLVGLTVTLWPSRVMAEDGKTLAVLELRAGETFSAAEVRVLSEKLEQGVLRVLDGGPHKLLTRDELAALSDESGIYLDDCDEELECEVDAARDLLVDFMLSVGVVRFGKVLVVTFKLYDVESGEVVASREEEAAEEQQ